ncbi:phosphatidylserine decarboxylase [Verruconis gallopava]|uniref:Phosphatidylserine decarboxylase proenzyme 2 n=1 Tax=Verruconis gallopava TaxID=253628 RepID=A0A0D2AX86_9PEZI|nr:phosphatidylserine decarboxylase [Verruconis gallopava]KIW03809.1 phosphatidylserine decarboxylase [Verruconis gallopava]
MVRPSLPSRLSGILSRTTTSSNPPSNTPSRSSSPKPGSRVNTGGSNAMPDNRTPVLMLKVQVIKGRDLAAKDKNNSSDPFLVITLGDAKEATSTVYKNLNPEWNQTFEMPIVDMSSLVLDAVCWDKDRFGKDYMGEFDVALEEIFADKKTEQEPRWYPLESRRQGKKSGVVTGAIQLKFSLYDPANPSAPPELVIEKLHALLGNGDLTAEEEAQLQRVNTSDVEDDEEAVSEIDEAATPEQKAKKRRLLRLAKLKRKAKERGYEFTGGTDVAGVLFVEIQKITDLPPEKNVTRTSFDMDPFVVTSLGRKTYRTRVIRHNLNPVYDEKLVFQVMKHEVNYSLSFSVVDRDKFSGNDYVGSANFPLEKAVEAAPTADPETGLYDLPDIPDGNPTGTEEKKKRFRLPLSRSSSSQSLSKFSKPQIQRESSSNNLNPNLLPDDAPLPSRDLPAPTSAPPPTLLSMEGVAGTMPTNSLVSDDDPDLRPYILPLDLKNKERWESKHNPTLYIRVKYLPYKALRQQFWRAMLKQYDADESGQIDKVELTTMLDTLGSTLHESTIDGFFARFSQPVEGEVPTLTFDQAVLCLEDQLQKNETKHSKLKPSSWTAHSSASLGNGSSPGVVTPSYVESGSSTPLNAHSNTTLIPAIQTTDLGKDGEEGELMDDKDLADERGEEHVIEIRECPICHQPRLNKKSDADIITHVATCASQDWRQVNNIVMAGFVTSAQAQRKWYSKVITKIGYGGYKLGANSANILVQDRLTGQINEERMSVYVRLGIRLLYKGLKANNMEKKRIKKLLKSLSIKQGRKYDDPASAAEIQGFIAFHQLDMSEVLLPIEKFRNFNEFFYRALKPGARPCSAPDRPEIITSPADCRTVVFNTLESAQTIWVKGRDFTVERLLGGAYPEDVKRYQNGALGIFRLAPQDYHRFHIPVDGVMGEPKLIEGEYYTVNPMAIRSALDVYGENVRVLVPIDSEQHGRVMVVCVGAMMVGSTVITRKAGEKVRRAEELGYFKFGGSTILLLFEPGVMVWDDDLVDNSNGALETLIRVGMSVGHKIGEAPHTPDMRKPNPTMAEKQDAKRRIEGSLAPDSKPPPSASLAA